MTTTRNDPEAIDALGAMIAADVRRERELRELPPDAVVVWRGGAVARIVGLAAQSHDPNLRVLLDPSEPLRSIMSGLS